MPFRERQKYILPRCTPVYEIEERTLESGKVKKEMIDQKVKVLPDPELFELKNQINAGVDLEEVNSKVLQQKVINADNVVRKYTKRSNNEDE